ncbi:MAG TPA: ferritin-like domain-containing protein [Longimicrobiaceae bacterium]|nr:ferritin-like domain-containing protein [Longimicrobiaceae bacterium]
MNAETIAALQAAREAERQQAQYYRGLAAQAEERADAALSERFNELHADEQHHLSRITARLMELGAATGDVGAVRAPEPGVGHSIDGWEGAARLREEAEVMRYEALAARELDAPTAALVVEILDTERHHAETLGGKWTPA